MQKKFFIEGKRLSVETESIYEDIFIIGSFPESYSVYFINLLEDVNKFYSNKYLQGKKSRFVVWDANVFKLHASKLKFLQGGQQVVTASESNKTLKSVLSLVQELQQVNFTKKETLVSAGGGIIQDITAFTRAIYKRGINWSYIPTTLLSMADSCIGAKTALNHNGVKNQLALFSAPAEVVICREFLNTLNEKEILSGFGEILKLVIIGGTYFINEFQQIWESNEVRQDKIVKLIKLSLKIKKAVIEADEYEKDIRRSLNYGHTIGHAIEPISSYKIPHGIAVSIGMIVENNIGARYGFLSANLAREYNNLILKFIPINYWEQIIGIDSREVYENILQDKKTMNKIINYAIPKSQNSFGILKVENTKFTPKILSSVFQQSLKEAGI